MTPHTAVVLPGHGVCVDPTQSHKRESWVGLYDYPEEPRLLVQHCERAVLLAASEPRSVLVFSGGATRKAAPELSEAQSYRQIAVAHRWWGFCGVEARSINEMHARDSLENLLLSLATFRVRLGHFPQRLLVVGFAFKEERFYLHAKAIQWSGEFVYYAVNDPPVRGGILDAALRGEAEKRTSLRRDPLLQAEKWSGQRRSRNPFGHETPSFLLDPELARYVSYFYGTAPETTPPWLKPEASHAN